MRLVFAVSVFACSKLLPSVAVHKFFRCAAAPKMCFANCLPIWKCHEHSIPKRPASTRPAEAGPISQMPAGVHGEIFASHIQTHDDEGVRVRSQAELLLHVAGVHAN